MATESQRKARNKYNAKKLVNKTVTLNKELDKDIIDYIQGENFTGLVKRLIRDEIKREVGLWEH